MNNRWAARFPHTSMHVALPLRLRQKIEACSQPDYFWLAGDGAVEEIHPTLRHIPDIVCYGVEGDGALTRFGRLIPEGALPTGPWSSFASLVQFQPQVAALPGRLRRPVSIRFVRTQREQEPAAVVVSVQQWADYADTAPQVRLAPLRFALCGDGRTLILGQPLPPLNGAYFVDRAGVLVPCGYAWEPAVEPEMLRRAMNMGANDLALFDIESRYESIPGEGLIQASRSAARRSLASFAQTGSGQ